MSLESSITHSSSSRSLGAENNLSALTRDCSRYGFWPDVNGHMEDRGVASLPVGWRERPCPKCGSVCLVGALISDSADMFDPNVLCTLCGYFC